MDFKTLGRVTKGRREDRAVDELVGLCRGLLADGHVNLQEAQFLRDWIERQAQFVAAYPFNVLYERVSMMLKDGLLDANEERDLLETLVSFVGGETLDHESEVTSLSSALPLCKPAPQVHARGAGFVATGTFACATRAIVEAAITAEGGKVQSAPTKNTSYLVIGELASRDWMHSTFGRKIEEAVALRSAGYGLAIISEAHWRASLSVPFG